MNFIIADTHGWRYSVLKPLSAYLKRRLIDGKNGRLIVLGDLVDGRNIKNPEDENEFIPAYTNYGVENCAILKRFQEWLGDGNIQVIPGNHELRFMFKHLVPGDSNTLSLSEFNQEESDSFSEWVRKMPLFGVVNDVFLQHAAGIPSLGGLKSLDDLKYVRKEYQARPRDMLSRFRAPPLPDEDNYELNLNKWFNETIVGQATFGREEEILFKPKNKLRSIRVIKKKDIEDTIQILRHLGMNVNQIWGGHTGYASKIFEDEPIPGQKYVVGSKVFVDVNGVQTLVGNSYPDSVNNFFHRNNHTILVTTEGLGCDTMLDDDGPSDHASWFASYKPYPNQLLIAKLGYEPLAARALDNIIKN
jgi:hypothetical protein